jgi:hypothetical protein
VVLLTYVCLPPLSRIFVSFRETCVTPCSPS